MSARIAVCDDEKNLRENLQMLIKSRYSDCHVDLFDSGNALLSANEDYDIYFLDIQMPGIDGMETAEQIRKKQKNAESIIIFITAFKEYMSKAFDVRAFHYLIKPVNETKFKVVFSRALNEYHKLNKNADRHIFVKSGNSMYKILIRDVIYVESQGKKVVIHTKSEAVEYYDKMQELEKTLGNSFFRCHRSYLVNMNHVERYSSTAIWLTNGSEIFLAQKRFQDFVKAYLVFARDGGSGDEQ